MSAVADTLIEMTDQVLKILGITDDDEDTAFDQVQEWILEHVALHEFLSAETIAYNFRQMRMCRQCGTIVDNPAACTCFTQERM